MRILDGEVYERLVWALESNTMSVLSVADIAIDIGDIADTSDTRSALLWIGGLIKTIDFYWQGDDKITDSLSIFISNLTNEIIGHLAARGERTSPADIRTEDYKLGLDDCYETIFERVIRHFRAGFEEVGQVRGYIESKREHSFYDLLEDDSRGNVRCTDELFSHDVRECVPDLIRPTLRGSAFCVRNTIWLYDCTEMSHAPHSVSLVSSSIRKFVEGLSLSKAKSRLELAISESKLEFHLGRDGQFWLPTLGRSISMRTLFEVENASDLYEGLRAYHAGGLLLISGHNDKAERFYRQMFVNPLNVSSVCISDDERVAVIVDRTQRCKSGTETRGNSNGRAVVGAEQEVHPHLRRLNGNRRQTEAALSSAKEAFVEGRITEATLRLLEADKTVTFVSEYVRNEGSSQKVILQELKDKNYNI